MDPCELSVVIPAYNEEAVIGSTIETVARYLQTIRVSHEILVVDDGSTDRTVEVVRAHAAQITTLRIMAGRHQGKGGAVQRGLRDARGTYLLFLDADLSTRIEEWEKFAPWLRNGYDVVIGSRKMPGAHVQRRQPVVREAMGKVFTWLTNAILDVQVTDVTCGFKSFRTDAARTIGSLQRVRGWAFDAEWLFLARWLGYRIKEVPVVWTDDASTKVRLVGDAARSFSELFAIRMAVWRGLYPPPACHHQDVGSITSNQSPVTKSVTGKW